MARCQNLFRFPILEVSNFIGLSLAIVFLCSENIVFDSCVPFFNAQCIPTASLDELDAMLREVNAELYRINELQLIRAAISSRKVEVKYWGII